MMRFDESDQTPLQEIVGTGRKVIFDDGRELVAKPFSLNDLVDLEVSVGPVDQVFRNPATRMKAIRRALWLCFRKGNDDLTEDDIGEMVSVADISADGPAVRLVLSLFPKVEEASEEARVAE